MPMIRLLLLWPWLLLATSLSAQLLPPRFVWTDASGEGRLQSAFFRYELELPSAPDSAVIELFADSRYHLRVNGEFVAFGPARHYPAHPTYDRHDLRPYLRPGPNVIAVQVLSNGTHSYQLRRQPAAFIAWGKVTAGGLTYDLRTPGDWQARPVRGLDPEAVRMTFALPAMEVYDARQDPQDWALPGFDASDWTPPVRLDRQGAWGNLRPRTIPPLTRDLYRPYALAGAYPLDDSRQIWSFRVKVPDQSGAEFRTGRQLLGYTWIHSPRKQEVEVGIWWGEHFLNGEGPLPQAARPGEEGYRQWATLRLKKGWNAFQVRRKSFWGKWDFYLSAPRAAGLSLSPDQRLGDSLCFRTLGPLPELAQDAEIEALALPFEPAAVAATWAAAWQDQPLRPVGVNPATDLAWQDYGPVFPVSTGQVDSLTVPDGSALVFDFRYKKLARVLIDYEAPAGTVIDVGFAEDTLAGRPWMLKRNGLYMAHRHIAAGGRGRLETFRPYGFRFLQVHIRESEGEAVKIHRVRAMQHVYPLRQEGDFACSDPMFNAIWDLGWRTLQVCAEDSYTDTPFRERGLYAGDMLPQMAITLVA
ncbi:MAG: hypothetical protein D6722_28190, partial [Bacteroidetes bacterium]